MPLTDQNLGFLQSLAEAGAKPFHSMTPTECRVAFDMLLGAMPPTTQRLAAVADRVVPAAHGEIPVRVYTPEGSGPLPAVVYFHGGGWVIGGLDSYDTLCTELAGRVGAVVVSVDYRLAPEARFPAAADDSLTALQWVAANAGELNIDAGRIAVAGDSAGGNLSAVTALRVRDEGGPALRGQVLLYPVTKLAGDPLPSLIENADGPLLTLADMEYFVGHYALSEDDARNPHCSPLFAESHANLPPALVQTCEFDPLRDEGEAYGQALQAAGNDVAITRYDGAFHGMLCFATALDQSKEMLGEVVDWLKVRLA
ncbi:MAG TPA: alpha/beta hydrolase [Sporichthyaceae bacterium]|jgi:acetyl esterase